MDPSPSIRDLDYYERFALIELAKRPGGEWDSPECYVGSMHLDELVLQGLVRRTPSAKQPIKGIRFHVYKLTPRGRLAAARFGHDIGPI
jgi:hypothetical protein